MSTITNTPLIRIDLEGCGGSQYWDRTLSRSGHFSRILAMKQSLTIEVEPVHNSKARQPSLTYVSRETPVRSDAK
ncbi:MAG: hypothetical protein GYB40_05985 [Vibrionaceae bacterium]|nr:hypothetical protein [Vibrionaceae bacterium]